MNSFLSRFNYENTTFQIFKDKKPIRVEFLPNGQLPKLAPEEELFFMVNEGDGIVHPPHKTCRSQKSVIRLKALFLDLDNVPLAQALSYLQSVQLEPHMIVESSPARFHLHILSEVLPKETKHVMLWKLCQSHLALLGTDKALADPSMSDVSRVLRVPGVLNRKASPPFMVRVVEERFHPPYHLNKVADRLKLSDEAPREKLRAHPISVSPVPSGQRHADLLHMLGHLSRSNLPQETAKALLLSRAAHLYQNGQDFLPSGKRHEEFLKALDYAYREAQIEKLDSIVSSPLPTSNDNFYFECPSLAGKITKEICSKAYLSNPPFTFATAAAVLGTLKGSSTSSLGHAPSNFFLCLGPTGSGKNYPQEVFSHTLHALALSSFCDLKLRSERGVLKLLQDHPSALIMSDEAEFFLSSLDDRFAPPYIKACKPLLLELYTATNKVFNFGRTGQESQIEILHPRLNYVGYGVLSTLEKAFNAKSIQDGLLQRFIIVTDFRPAQRNLEFKPAASLNGNIFEELKEQRRLITLASEEDLISLTDLELEIEQAKQDKKQKKLKELKLKHSELKLKIKRSEKTIIECSPQAKRALEAFSESLLKRRNQEIENPLCGLWTRGAEQAGRLSVALSGVLGVTPQLMEWCIEFIEQRLNAVHEQCEGAFTTGIARKSKDYLLKITRFIKENNGAPCTKRTLLNSMASGDRKEFSEAIKFLEETGKIRVLEQYRNGERGRTGEAYELDEVI